MQVLKGPKQNVEALAFSPDGLLLAVGGQTGRVDVWNLASGAVVKLATQPGTIMGVAFAPDNSALIAWSAGNLGEAVRYVAPQLAVAGRKSGRTNHCIYTADLSPDGTILATAGSNSLVAYLPAEDFRELWGFPADYTLGLAAPVFAPDGKRIAVYRYPQMNTAPIHRIEVRSAVDGAVTSSFDVPQDSHRLVCWSPDGRLVVTVGPRLAVQDANTGRLVIEHPAEKRKPFTDARFHPTTPHLLATADDGTVRVYSTDAWQEVQCYGWGFPKVKSVVIAPDGMRAAVGGSDGRVAIWDWDL